MGKGYCPCNGRVPVKFDTLNMIWYYFFGLNNVAKATKHKGEDKGMNNQVVSQKMEGITLTTKANVWYDGKVISYTFRTPDGQRHSVGIIFPGNHKFQTACREKMQITTGALHVYGVPNVNVDDVFRVGAEFEVPANTQFRMVCDVPTEYICSFFD
jgi:purine/pyrimidine-nucleoside phosphorylase